MRASLFVVILTALSASANNINEQCQIYNGRRIKCRCIGNEEFILPDEYNYTKVDSLIIAGCKSVNLHYSSLPEATDLKEIIIQNISSLLNFDIYITSKRIKIIKLSDIGQIPSIMSHTFISLMSIDTFIIENAHIVNFYENFSFVNVLHFIMSNVTIDHLDQLNLPEKGKTLYIMNSELRNVTTSLTFTNIDTIEIINSKFRLQKSNLLSILGQNVVIKDSVFLNASISLNAVSATIHGICADGKSTLRSSSDIIESVDNRLPNEIIYITRDNQPVKLKSFQNRNNRVCKAGNCKCSKMSGLAPCSAAYASLLIVGCLLTSLFR